MKTLTKPPVYPVDYNRAHASERTREYASKRFGIAFNKWTAYIREANLRIASQSGMETFLENAKNLIGIK